MNVGVVVSLIRFDGDKVLCEICGELVYNRDPVLRQNFDVAGLIPESRAMALAMLAHMPMHVTSEIEAYMEILRAQARIIPGWEDVEPPPTEAEQ